MVLNRIALMNDTVQEVYRRFGDHHMRSSNVFSDVDERIMEFRTQQMHTDDRITRMEVKVSVFIIFIFIQSKFRFSPD